MSELGLDGKRIANHKPKIADEEFFINLRSAAGRDGKRYFAAFAPAEQRFHLFDEKFNHLLSYPADALENRHAGLGDVELGDLDGDGVLKAYVGFAGMVGVKCVSLQGTRDLVLPQPVQRQPRPARPGRRAGTPRPVLRQRCQFAGHAGRQRPVARRDKNPRRRPCPRSCCTPTLTGSGQETWCGDHVRARPADRPAGNSRPWD